MIARALELGPIVLASSSPRRREILGLLGIEFTVVVPDYEEAEIAGLGPAELAEAHARGKAAAVAGDRVLGVDTLVALDGRVFGKPRDEAEARAFLGALAGRTHTVHSGLCLRAGGVEHVRRADERGDVRPAHGRPTSSGTSRRASGATGPAPTPSRAAARRSCARCAATSRTSSACRSPSCSTRWRPPRPRG